MVFARIPRVADVVCDALELMGPDENANELDMVVLEWADAFCTMGCEILIGPTIPSKVSGSITSCSAVAARPACGVGPQFVWKGAARRTEPRVQQNVDQCTT